MLLASTHSMLKYLLCDDIVALLILKELVHLDDIRMILYS